LHSLAKIKNSVQEIKPINQEKKDSGRTAIIFMLTLEVDGCARTAPLNYSLTDWNSKYNGYEGEDNQSARQMIDWMDASLHLSLFGV
jgi:hypothetical protein